LTILKEPHPCCFDCGAHDFYAPSKRIIVCVTQGSVEGYRSDKRGTRVLNEKYRLLTQTNPDTPMGILLRRYWMPIAGASELDANPVMPVRLMGEDLVLYRDKGGRYGLLDRHCPHRRADLSYGFVEECGLRCNYHGWRYGQDGDCLERPYEDVANPGRPANEISIKAYPVQELGGLLFAYLGPLPAPQLPRWDFFTWRNGFRQIVKSEVPCNWLQGQENSIDPVHFEWMHENWSLRLGQRGGSYSPKHTKVDFEEFDYGFRYKRIRENTNEADAMWTLGRICLWPNMLYTGNHCEWRVPIDDENTLSISWFFARVPNESEPYEQNEVPTWVSPVRDAETGRWITSHIMNQDFVAWVGQGRIADRSREHLGASDKGIALIRRRFLEDIERVRRGEDPKAVIRDAAANAKGIHLAVAFRSSVIEGLPRAKLLNSEYARRFLWSAGQPERVWQSYIEAMGFRPDELA